PQPACGGADRQGEGRAGRHDGVRDGRDSARHAGGEAMKPKEISDEGMEALTELFFHRLPALSSEDLVDLLEAGPGIAAREVARATEEMRSAWSRPASN